MIARAWYVQCDVCGDPAEVSVEGAKDALRLARGDNFERRRVDQLPHLLSQDGRTVDLCSRCAVGEGERDE